MLGIYYYIIRVYSTCVHMNACCTYYRRKGGFIPAERFSAERVRVYVKQ